MKTRSTAIKKWNFLAFVFFSALFLINFIQTAHAYDSVQIENPNVFLGPYSSSVSAASPSIKENCKAFQGCFATPAASLVKLNNGYIYTAWADEGSHQLKVMVSKDGGSTFGLTTLFNERSDVSPSLATDGSNLYIAWKGDGNDILNIAKILIAADGTGYLITNKVQLPKTDETTSLMSPALAYMKGRLYLAWKDQNNYIRLLSGIVSPTLSFNMGELASTPQLSFLSPTLYADDNTNMLYIAWTGLRNEIGPLVLGGHVNVGVVSLEPQSTSVPSQTQYIPRGISHKAVLTTSYTKNSPAITRGTSTKKMYVVWVNDSDRQSDSNGNEWRQKRYMALFNTFSFANNNITASAKSYYLGFRVSNTPGILPESNDNSFLELRYSLVTSFWGMVTVGYSGGIGKL
jgi:hypothetical protein